MRRIGILIRLICCAAFLATTVYAEDQATDERPFRRPYGGYHKGGRGGMYGERVTVKNAEDARQKFIEYYKGTDLQVGEMMERPRFFKADILDGSGNLKDIVIIDRFTGRIRSIY